VPVLVISLVALLGIAGVGVALASHHDTGGTPSVGGTPVLGRIGSSDSAPPSLPSVDDTESSGPVSPSAEPSQPVDNASAKAALDAEVAQDEAIAEGVIDNWVPQLSSKRPGLVADGITYDYLSIWLNFQQLRDSYPNALLLWSGDYTSFKLKDFYVTIVPQPYSDGAAANQWCADENIDVDNCYAKLLSHTSGPTGTTLLRQ
jgi:hypothetical protein